MRALMGCWLVTVLLLTGCQTRLDVSAPPLSDATEHIELIYRDWHTSLMLPASAFEGTSLAPVAESYEYVRVGFGDGDYFTGKSAGVGAATRALVLSKYSALQVIRYTHHPEGVIPPDTRVILAVTPQGLADLVAYIEASLAKEQGTVVPLKAYQASTGVFFLAAHPYGWRQNCNTWSANALRIAGLPVKGKLNLTSTSVFSQAKTIAQQQGYSQHLAP